LFIDEFGRMKSAVEVKSLKPDCTKCHALCCVALAFDWPHYAKPAGVPCKNLDDDFRCSKWDVLEKEGYRQCRRFSCHGAGQAVAQYAEENAIANWREAPPGDRVELGIFQQVYSELYSDLIRTPPLSKNNG
jgi:hypothetical protein